MVVPALEGEEGNCTNRLIPLIHTGAALWIDGNTMAETRRRKRSIYADEEGVTAA
ncbi:MAG: hypothetical protein WD333_04255 [Dehalococcoidia bacterium]